MDRPWLAQSDTPVLQRCFDKVDALFGLLETLDVPFFCFHDRDLVPEVEGPVETSVLLDRVMEHVSERMSQSGKRLLWGTANLFSHPRYRAGAATSPDPEVFAHAASQVKQALEWTHSLGGENYVLWGGREGYDTLLHTDLRRESEQLGRFLAMVAEHKAKIGFQGTLLIEPKPCEPTKHQYDTDVATVDAFLQRFGLADEYRVNIEVNHATLAGKSFHHEVAEAFSRGLFGSVDANRGDPQNGWDTDQFPNSVEEMTLALYEILRHGGLTTGGFNFDAKLRRQSVDLGDLIHAHVGGIDTLALALLCAERLIDDGRVQAFVEQRYEGWDAPLGQSIQEGVATLASLDAHVQGGGAEVSLRSGRQEALENVVRESICDALRGS